MNKSNFKKGLVGLGIGTLIVTGIYMYFNKEKDYLTYEEYLATIEVYNWKMEEIKADCENDVRCSKGKVIFRNVRKKKDVLDQLNHWIEDDAKDAKTYKLK